jgi:hypothetical protein
LGKKDREGQGIEEKEDYFLGQVQREPERSRKPKRATIPP